MACKASCMIRRIDFVLWYWRKRVPLGIFATIYMAIYTFVFDEDNVGRKYAILSKVMQMLGVQRFAIYGCSLLAPRLTLPLAVRHVSHVERWSFVVR